MSYRIGRTYTACTQRGRTVSGKLIEKRVGKTGSTFLVLQTDGGKKVCVRPSGVYRI